MRSLIAAFTAAGSLCLSGHDLATDYGRVRTLKTSAELELDLETTAYEMKIDDEPVEGRGPGGGSSSLVRTCVLVDHVLEGSGASPKHLKRSFEALHDESSFSFGEEERKDEHDYPLQGVTLDLSVDQDGAVQAEVIDGTKPDDDALLEGHELALALDAFLPEGAVEAGASWELDDATLKRALASALDAKFFAQPAPEESERGEGERGRRGAGRGRGGPGRMLGFLVWQGKAKLIETDAERDGLTCAKIALELEGTGELPEPSSRGGRGFFFDPPRDFEGRTTPRAGTVQAKLDGELFVSLEKKRPVALKLDGNLRSESSFERERDGRRFSSHSTQEGRLTLTMQIEEQGP